ncbi:MAG: hypothetical protein Q9179_004932 [Wetmoreana sp. 5 TL-2023]
MQDGIDSQYSPTELATFEHGTYEESKQELNAAARRVALEIRQIQTLQQLERMQIDQTGTPKLRAPRPMDIAELDSGLLRPVELPSLIGEINEQSSTFPECGTHELTALKDAEGLSKQGNLQPEAEPSVHSLESTTYSDAESPGNWPTSDDSYNENEKHSGKREIESSSFCRHDRIEDILTEGIEQEAQPTNSSSPRHHEPISTLDIPRHRTLTTINVRSATMLTTVSEPHGDEDRASCFADIDMLIKASRARISYR